MRRKGSFPKEEGEAIREYKAMHEENFLSSWLWGSWEREERTVEMSNENEEERCKNWRREREEEENGRTMLKGDETILFLWRLLTSSVMGEIWRVVVVFLGETFLEKLEDLSDRKPEIRVDVLVVLDVIDVFVSFSSVVTEFCDGSSVVRIGNLWNCSRFLSHQKRAHSCTVTQEEMRFEGPQVKAPPLSGRTMPPTPLQQLLESIREWILQVFHVFRRSSVRTLRR